MPSPPQAPVRQKLLAFLTPSIADLLFYETVDGRRVGSDPPEYGTAHPDTKNWPNHKLVYVKQADEEGQFFRWYYAASRESQHLYNYEIKSDDTLVRTFVIPRADYPDDFAPPAVGTVDVKFPQYSFASEFLVDAGDELRSIFVVIQRVYSKPLMVGYSFDTTVDHIVKTTREIVPAGTEVGSTTPGRVVEIRPQNTFFDLKITAEVVDNAGDPIDWDAGDVNLTTVPTYAEYQFPPRLDSVECYGVWAWADSTKAQESYSEDFFFETKFTEPALGPYSAHILRILTQDPDAVRAAYPLDKVVSKRDTFGMLKAWFKASTKGNSTFALARQFDVGRPCIHPEITLPENINYVQGAPTTTTTAASGSATLPATPSYSSFVAKTTLTVSVTTRQTAYGLWEAQVLQIVLPTSVQTAIYGGSYTAPTSPAITVQPSDDTIASGETASFSVTATGTAPLAYRWYRGNVGDLSDPTDGTSDSYTTPALTETTKYWVRVGNSAGYVNSVQVQATVTPP